MRYACALALALACGCASASAARVSLDRARVAEAERLSAAQRAPELMARADSARKAAQRAPDASAERADYATTASLWLEAAIAEAQRAELAEARLELERDSAGEATALESAERELASVAAEVERASAAQLAREEARRALERASLAPKQRPKLARAEVVRAAEALLARAQLVVVAFSAYGADPHALAPALTAIDDARAVLAKDPDVALDRADRALFLALAAYGPARARQPAPSEAEAAALAGELLDAGARVTRADRGLSAVLDKAFAGTALTPVAAKRLSRLCALAVAHPHGPVRGTVGAPTATRAHARAAALTKALAQAGCAGERFAVDVTELASDDVELTWLSY